MSNINKSKSRMHELLFKGADYREDFEFELYGEEVTAIIRPLADPDFLPLVALLAEKFDLDDEVENARAVDEASERIEEADEGEEIDVSEMDEEFVAVMQNAARLGLEGTYNEDGNVIDIDDEEAEELVRSMIGGTSIEMGSRVLELSGSVREAEKFR